MNLAVRSRISMMPWKLEKANLNDANGNRGTITMRGIGFSFGLVFS